MEWVYLTVDTHLWSGSLTLGPDFRASSLTWETRSNRGVPLWESLIYSQLSGACITMGYASLFRLATRYSTAEVQVQSLASHSSYIQYNYINSHFKILICSSKTQPLQLISNSTKTKRNTSNFYCIQTRLQNIFNEINFLSDQIIQCTKAKYLSESN